ncbi:hypothetical protein [Bradyrhizobium yuanmingense]|uniref:hypothetical protein n=1 Tax=Bradyrhizobium yuanmingense TaxID=108015 RepID=UPI0012E355C6|nr:hypothetical protein [Bradyrhizobium yuanmingense]
MTVLGEMPSNSAISARVCSLQNEFEDADIGRRRIVELRITATVLDCHRNSGLSGGEIEALARVSPGIAGKARPSFGKSDRYVSSIGVRIFALNGAPRPGRRTSPEL